MWSEGGGAFWSARRTLTHSTRRGPASPPPQARARGLAPALLQLLRLWCRLPAAVMPPPTQPHRSTSTTTVANNSSSYRRAAQSRRVLSVAATRRLAPTSTRRRITSPPPPKSTSCGAQRSSRRMATLCAPAVAQRVSPYGCRAAGAARRPRRHGTPSFSRSNRPQRRCRWPLLLRPPPLPLRPWLSSKATKGKAARERTARRVAKGKMKKKTGTRRKTLLPQRASLRIQSLRLLPSSRPQISSQRSRRPTLSPACGSPSKTITRRWVNRPPPSMSPTPSATFTATRRASLLPSTKSPGRRY